MREERQRLSEAREANIRKHFSYISWDFAAQKMKRYGHWGDRPSYYIPGRFNNLRLRLLTYGPGGSEQSLRIMNKDGKRLMTFRPAPFYKAEEIQYILMRLNDS